ncbi:MAG TPA: YbaL family putative K(+) efflux transporter [Lysobacter sp.]|nr:YbaL family putative K(+) efflux transporter [Lysobacter sp.]
MSHPLIATLVAAFVLAFVLGTLAQRLRLSPIAGYLLAGVVVGPFTPGFIGDRTLTPQLAEVGVMLLMFGVGLHFSMRDLLAVRAVAVPGALLRIALVTPIGWALARFGFGWRDAAGVLFGLALSVASTVVLMRSLEDRRLLDTGTGRLAVGWLIVEDIAMVLALVLLPPLAGLLEGDARGDGVLGPLAWTLVKVAAFVALMLAVGRRVIPWLLERVAGTGSRELFTLCVLAIALGVAFGSAELFGVSFALGAFFAGSLLNESEFSHQAANETLPLRDAFAVLFFVSVGMLFDPSILLDRPLHVAATFALVVAVKAALTWALVRGFGGERTAAATIAVSLAQIGEFSFVLASLGLQLRILPGEGHDLILAAALLSIVVNPLLLAWMERREHAARAREPRPPSPLPPTLEGHVLVIGYGRVGSELARLLRSRDVTVVVVDGEEDRIERARSSGLLAIRGNAADARVLAEARPEHARMALLAIPNALEAGEVVASLRAANPALAVIARAHSDAGVRHLLEHGADGAVMAERELAHSLAEMVLATPDYRGSRQLPPAAL